MSRLDFDRSLPSRAESVDKENVSDSSADQPLIASTEDLLATAVEAIGGAPRPGQIAMANAVTQALESDRHLAVEAGTGTGKSLAYLIPAIRHAQATDSTVVVSTATLALQRQLIDRDLPRLVEALEPVLERTPTYAIMKGRSNYVCLNKISQVADEPDALIDEDQISWVGKQVARVHNWAQETDTGDRDALDPGVSDLAWRQVSVTATECLGASRCPHGAACFAELAKHKAQDVDIIVTNHALLAIDALADINILPEHDAVIIDEAHELDGRITSVSTNEISSRSLKMAAKRADKLGATADPLTSSADDFAAITELMEPGRWTRIDDSLRGTLDGLRTTLWTLREEVSRTPEGEPANDPEKFAERQNLQNHLGDLHDALVRILEVFDADGDATDVDDVVWIERSDRSGDTLAVAPLSVAALLRDTLFAEQTVVLTSATLTVGGNFNAMATAWGLPQGSWESLNAGSPFNPKKSGILYTAQHLPAPGRDGLAPETLNEIAELITAAGGRTLGLFSSRRAAEQAAEAMRERLPFDIYLQGEETTGILVERFSNNENSVLFGTLGLWQGVDVPGSALSLVIIDRIPFPRPDDPLLQARTEAANAAGRSGFMEVSATHAALLMAQGAGRLLRHTTDRGVVAVLDNRLVTKRYGSFLRASLPPFWETTDPQVVRGALARVVAKD